MKFLCDEMLRGLARWLRVAGYDTTSAEAGEADAALLARARAQGRRLLTRDRKMGERKGSDGVVVLLVCNDTEGCSAALERSLPVDWLHAPFSRCLRCNTPLTDAPDAMRERVPENVLERGEALYCCESCNRVYWEGGHVRRMREKLERWRRRAGRSCAPRSPDGA